MTLTHSQERVAPPAERVAVRCVDSDVHPVPKRGVLQEYIPEPIRTKYFKNHRLARRSTTTHPTMRTPTRCGWTPSPMTASSPAATPPISRSNRR